MGAQLNKMSDVSVKVIAPTHYNKNLKYGELPKIGKYINEKLFSKRLQRRINRLLSPYIIRSQNHNIIHETYFSSNALLDHDCATIITVYDMIHEKFPDLFIDDPTSEYKKNAVERADKVICISDSTKSDLLNLFDVSKDKVTTVHLGFSFSNMDSAIANKISISKPFILYVGQRGHHKNFISLLKAYSTTNILKKEIDIIAFGGGEFTQREQKLITDYSIDDKSIHQLSGDDNLLIHLYQKATLFCCPSLYEGFGLPILEAMASGCPVICSNTSSLPEIAGDAAHYFDPFNIDSLKTSLEQVVYDNSLRFSLIEKGDKRHKRFSWEKCANETYKVYSECI